MPSFQALRSLVGGGPNRKGSSKKRQETFDNPALIKPIFASSSSSSSSSSSLTNDPSPTLQYINIDGAIISTSSNPLSSSTTATTTSNNKRSTSTNLTHCSISSLTAKQLSASISVNTGSPHPHLPDTTILALPPLATSLSGTITITNHATTPIPAMHLSVSLLSGQHLVKELSHVRDPEAPAADEIHERPLGRTSVLVWARPRNILPGSHTYEFTLPVAKLLPPTIHLPSAPDSNITHHLLTCLKGSERKTLALSYTSLFLRRKSNRIQHVLKKVDGLADSFTRSPTTDSINNHPTTTSAAAAAAAEIQYTATYPSPAYYTDPSTPLPTVTLLPTHNLSITALQAVWVQVHTFRDQITIDPANPPVHQTHLHDPIHLDYDPFAPLPIPYPPDHTTQPFSDSGNCVTIHHELSIRIHFAPSLLDRNPNPRTATIWIPIKLQIHHDRPVADPVPPLPVVVKQPTTAKPVVNTPGLYRALHPYDPTKLDELQLKTGDLITIIECWTDGWGLGHLVSSGVKGVVPLCVLEPLPAPAADSASSIQSSRRTVSSIAPSSHSASQEIITSQPPRHAVQASVSDSEVPPYTAPSIAPAADPPLHIPSTPDPPLTPRNEESKELTDRVHAKDRETKFGHSVARHPNTHISALPPRQSKYHPPHDSVKPPSLTPSSKLSTSKPPSLAPSKLSSTTTSSTKPPSTHQQQQQHLTPPSYQPPFPTSAAQLDALLAQNQISGPVYLTLRQKIAELARLDQELVLGNVSGVEYLEMRGRIMET
ncbi:hypothetical protein DFS34DRAFT_304884 [Phlyctochytrium arcticum]|nr:hypothetical protein DFS34DRAFT_304884 [Phlyctochytrium arcticum]